MKALGTLFIAVLLAVVAALVFIYSGGYNVAANVPHAAATQTLLGIVMKNSVRTHARDIAVPELSPQMARAGAGHFREHCAQCHGAPGVKRSDIGQGMTPEPPDLAKKAQDWSSGELFWIVRNGIKMTGMPAWSPSHSDEEIWQTVAFVVRLPRMSASEYQDMAALGLAHEDEHERHDHDH